jgi:ketosteroid isomerase-like protein
VRKYILFILILLILTGCNPSKEVANVANNPESKATQAIVEQYISAYKNFDADALLALYSDDYIFMDYGLNDGPLEKGNISYFIKESMAEPDTWATKFDSYTITPNGVFAVLDGTFSMEAKSSGEMLTVPAYVVLEIKDGKVVNETWYYNGEVFH